MSSWQGKSRGTPLGYRIFVWVLRYLGVQPAYFLLRFVSFYFYLTSWKASKAIYYLYHKRLGFGRVRSVWSIYKNYYMLGQSIIDKVVLMSGIPNKFSFHFDGEEHLREIAALNRGGILLSAHVGNWDIAGHLFTRLETTINIVMYDGEHEQIKKYLEGVTGKRRINVIIIKEDLSHIYAISEAFKRNELVCMHADRFLEGNKTITAPFLGGEARFPIGPFVLTATFKVPVSFVFALKESPLHYHFFASPIKDYSNFGKDKVLQAMLEDYTKAIEEKVRQYPLQWYNYFHFWQ